MTKRLVELQAKGYDLDFQLQDSNLLCLQDSQAIQLSIAVIRVIDQVYDRSSRSFKYIHTVDTGNGDKGIMVCNEIINSETSAYLQ